MRQGSTATLCIRPSTFNPSPNCSRELERLATYRLAGQSAEQRDGLVQAVLIRLLKAKLPSNLVAKAIRGYLGTTLHRASCDTYRQHRHSPLPENHPTINQNLDLVDLDPEALDRSAAPVSVLLQGSIQLFEYLWWNHKSSSDFRQQLEKRIGQNWRDTSATVFQHEKSLRQTELDKLCDRHLRTLDGRSRRNVLHLRKKSLTSAGNITGVPCRATHSSTCWVLAVTTPTNSAAVTATTLPRLFVDSPNFDRGAFLPNRKLFIAVATGQRVANTIPILELMEPGDGLLWLESDVAHSADWNSGPLKVLTNAGIKVVERIGTGAANRKADFNEVLKAILQLQADNEYQEILLIGNGGTKLCQILLWAPLRQIVGASMVYGDFRPCQLQIIGPNNELKTLLPYQRPLDLARVLEANNRFTYEATELWTPKTKHELPVPYVEDLARTRELHAHAWALSQQYAKGIIGLEGLKGNNSFKRCLEDNERSTKRFLNSCVHFVRSMAKLVQVKRGQSLKTNNELALAFQSRPQQLSQLLSAVSNLAQSHKSFSAKPNELPTTFEQAVSRRLVDWLSDEANQASRFVAGAWSKVIIRTDKHPKCDELELDTVLLLRSGQLLHLECKTGTVATKDIDARLLTLQRSSSILSAMALCLPLLTELSEEPWFDHYHTLWQRIQSLASVRPLALTRQGQPGRYQRGELTIQVPTFEDGLDRWLGPYRPQTNP